jgi:hypothetical protein
MKQSHVVSARLPVDLVKQLDHAAELESRTRTGQLTAILRTHLARCDSASRRNRITNVGATNDHQ